MMECLAQTAIAEVKKNGVFVVPGIRRIVRVERKARMTGKASAAKAAEGDEPVFAYIASLPQPQRSIAERIDALAANTLPSLQRAVKWGMAYYGVGGGWCFSSGAFVGHVKLMFIRGTEIKPEPPVTPIGMGKSTRGVELASVDDLDEHQVASCAIPAWMKAPPPSHTSRTRDGFGTSHWPAT